MIEAESFAMHLKHIDFGLQRNNLKGVPRSTVHNGVLNASRYNAIK